MMECYNYEVLKYLVVLSKLASSFKMYVLFCTFKCTGCV